MALTFTALPSEKTNASETHQSDIENQYNKLVRGLKELTAAINGSDAGNDINGTALEDYTGIGVFDELDSRGIPVGGMIDWPSDTLPAVGTWGWCNGQAISRTTYADCFTVCSTTYGVGDGSTTFNLPDFRDRVRLGQNDMGGLSDAGRVTNGSDSTGALADTGGAGETTLAEANLASHDHGISDNVDSQSGSSTRPRAIGNTSRMSTTAGSGTAFSHMNPYQVTNIIMRID